MRLAVVIALTGILLAGSPAQAQVELVIGVDLKARPGGPVIASISPGTRVTTGGASGSDTQVTFEGWVDASRLGPRRDSFPATVSGRLTLRVRAQASQRAAIVAVLQPGTGLFTLSRQGTWTRVRRTAWAPTAAVQRAAAGALTAAGRAARTATPPTAAAGPAARAGTAVATTGVVGSAGARLRDLPVGRVFGGLTPGSAVEVLGRQSGWVRVRADGWIADKDLGGADSLAPPGVRAADLRADPQGMKGRVVQWDVEILSLQIADPLRVELGRDEPYLLARGPGDENVVLYLAVPGNLLVEARGLPPLSKVRITARVRSGRSEPAGTPILDLLSITKR